MRATSPKRSQRNREAKPFRDGLIERVNGKCEWCPREGTQEHHIANGQNRQLCLGKLYAILWLCQTCHDDLHELPKAHAVCIALALLRYSRPEHFDLEAFYKLIARRYPSEELVERWWQRTLNRRTR